jgi:hypothetical protein
MCLRSNPSYGTGWLGALNRHRTLDWDFHAETDKKTIIQLWINEQQAPPQKF